eukprot:GFKZ01013058.1.p1 GENE.GFKZ01013058.1~~GFKZ01013058.1.p1  ORF type:complete len:411 (-),score=63.23 GFKZ01013058.1:1809-2945(-)
MDAKAAKQSIPYPPSSPTSSLSPKSSSSVQKIATVPPPPRRMKIFYTPEFKNHRPPPRMPHPECPERLDACVKALKGDGELAGLLDWITPQPVTGELGEERRKVVMDAVRRAHDVDGYLEEVERVSKKGGALDGDTYVAPGSFEIALMASGAWMEAVDLALDGERGAWVLSRPPGHHAMKGTGMGFCLLNHAAVAAIYALSKEGVEKVGILDFDVHHGNGTEDIVRGVEGLRFVSSHQWPLYPGSGEEGIQGNVRNLNLEAGCGRAEYLERYEEEMVGWLCEEGVPDLVVVSAGFDAMRVDPLAGLDFEAEDYRVLTDKLMKRLGEGCGVVFGLEGGYELGEEGVGAGVKECVTGFCLGSDGESAGEGANGEHNSESE